MHGDIVFVGVAGHLPDHTHEWLGAYVKFMGRRAPFSGIYALHADFVGSDCGYLDQHPAEWMHYPTPLTSL